MTTANTLVQRTRRFMGDWPQLDTITASASSSVTTLTVADATIYSPNWLIELDSEVMRVKTNAPGTALGVSRGQAGTTAASHASGATILVRPDFYTQEYLDAVNDAYQATWPYLYRHIIDTTITTTADTYEYAVPSVSSSISYIPLIYQIDVLYSGDTDYLKASNWEIVRGSAPKIKFRSTHDAGATLRVYGYAPFEELTTLTDSLSTLFPTQLVPSLKEYAAGILLASGEARRVRTDTLPADNRETANKAGSSIQTSNQLYQRFMSRVQACAMPPMSKHIKTVI